MLAEIITLVIVAVAVLGPGSYLLHVAWRRGGTPRRVAIAVLVAMFMLVAWLFGPFDAGRTREEHLSDFIGAWGILFMGVGVVVIVAATLGRFRAKDPRDPEA